MAADLEGSLAIYTTSSVVAACEALSEELVDVTVAYVRGRALSAARNEELRQAIVQRDAANRRFATLEEAAKRWDDDRRRLQNEASAVVSVVRELEQERAKVAAARELLEEEKRSAAALARELVAAKAELAAVRKELEALAPKGAAA